MNKQDKTLVQAYNSAKGSDKSETSKLEWKAPKLITLSMNETKTGTNFIVPFMEGSFYNPS